MPAAPLADWDLPVVPGLGPDEDPGEEARRLIRDGGGPREEVMQALADWVRESKLPEMRDGALVKFAHSCDYDLERAKKCVKSFHSARSQAADLFSEWDTELPNIRSILNVVRIAVMPRKTPDNYRVIVDSLQTSDTTNYVFLDVCRVTLMVLESIFLSEPTVDGIIVVHDVGNATISHFTKIGWSCWTTARKFSSYTQDALPLIRHSAHLVNCSGFIDKALRLVSHLGSKEDWEKLSVHRGDDVTGLHQRVPPECLPSDLGGSLPSLAELHGIQQNKGFALRADNSEGGTTLKICVRRVI
ncbi:Alpha-tocopherol transfer protein-like [Frankliniella fusca]|uniref:Alpha-tocopherol transfer protein-like n=1 Tax=Frankliniella fusca TaxID=407009 RepID=A0AAE1L7U5_9NEOP|nr:Alpha-tocopherol transfer protein-like [Frankliniella fusca]